MKRITYEVDAHSTFPLHYSGELRVTLNDGRVITHREAVNRGHAERPMSNAEVREKFFDNASLHFSDAHAEAICSQVLSLERIVSVHTLEALLANAPTPRG